jgi:amino acid transporter
MAQTPKSLGLSELVAICLGGMIGDGIFSILGVAVEQVGNAAPIATAIGATLALGATFSYAQLVTYYEVSQLGLCPHSQLGQSPRT